MVTESTNQLCLPHVPKEYVLKYAYVRTVVWVGDKSKRASVCCGGRGGGSNLIRVPGAIQVSNKWS